MRTASSYTAAYFPFLTVYAIYCFDRFSWLLPIVLVLFVVLGDLILHP